ncbi:MAG: hypothetical protein DMF93_11935 [Acidobacteria bacterium]|nr:MAG: hypothetical protein DMF93_11935 [Acidobacteriota bacterium]
MVIERARAQDLRLGKGGGRRLREPRAQPAAIRSSPHVRFAAAISAMNASCFLKAVVADSVPI